MAYYNQDSIDLAARRLREKYKNEMEQSLLFRIRDDDSISRERNKGAANQTRNIGGSSNNSAVFGARGGNRVGM